MSEAADQQIHLRSVYLPGLLDVWVAHVATAWLTHCDNTSAVAYKRQTADIPTSVVAKSPDDMLEYVYHSYRWDTARVDAGKVGDTTCAARDLLCRCASRPATSRRGHWTFVYIWPFWMAWELVE